MPCESIVPEVTLYVASACQLKCEGCIMAHFMSANKGYQMSLEELKQFLDVSEESGYRIDLVLSGGEPLLWKHLKDGLQIMRESPVCNSIVMYTNALYLKAVDQEMMMMLDRMNIAKYDCNNENAYWLQKKYPRRVKIYDHREFWQSPLSPLEGVLPCQCINKEHLYMKGKVYACAHAGSLNYGSDDLPDGTKIYTPLEVGYLDKMKAIRQAQEKTLCSMCLSNLKVRRHLKKIKKQDKVRKLFL